MTSEPDEPAAQPATGRRWGWWPTGADFSAMVGMRPDRCPNPSDGGHENEQPDGGTPEGAGLTRLAARLTQLFP